MRILVTGGAGHIGSHTVVELINQGHEVTVFDNLSTGHKEAVKCPLVVGDLLDKNKLSETFSQNSFDGVIHFAGKTLPGESMKDPKKYFDNNVSGGINLLEAMKNAGVNKIVFSSSASIYGFPDKLPATEEDDKKPTSVYGESKLMFETILQWYDSLFGIKNVCLRYFNACGDSIDGSIGEDHTPETHLIPSVLKAALGYTEKFVLNGSDYKTKDGTCVRDYIHVVDLAEIHVRSLDYLAGGNESNFFNCGTGDGYSNKEIIEKIKEISQVDFKVEIGPRRPGDPDAIYADNTKIKKMLNWEPRCSDLETIIKTAWNWHKIHPDGYNKKEVKNEI